MICTMTEDKRDGSHLCNNEQDDMLSDFPDHILLNILDRLEVRDAARTSVLSRRWRQLPFMLSRLVINVFNFLDWSKCENENFARGNTAVTQVTKNMLVHRDSSRNTIHMLSITFFLREDDPMIIGHAVGHAMATHKVEIAEFFVLTEKNNRNDDDMVNYGRKFMLFFDACPNAFGGLTGLHVVNLRFGESDICNILNTCKRLKYLSLGNCDSGSGGRLQVEHPQLSELDVYDLSFERVELNSVPKLTRLRFGGWLSLQDPISFGNVPLLEAVSLINVAHRWHNMVKLSKFLWGISVRDLKLGFHSQKIWVQPEKPTKRLALVFQELRFVNLVCIPEGCDLCWTFFILEAAPNLKDLYLSVSGHECLMETDSEKRKKKGVEWELPASNFQHHSLATLAISKFAAEDYLINYVRRVMEAAMNLEVVFLIARLECDECDIDPPKPSATGSQSTRGTGWKKDFVDKFITEGIKSSATVHLQTDPALADAHLKKLSSL